MDRIGKWRKRDNKRILNTDNLGQTVSDFRATTEVSLGHLIQHPKGKNCRQISIILGRYLQLGDLLLPPTVMFLSSRLHTNSVQPGDVWRGPGGGKESLNYSDNRKDCVTSAGLTMSQSNTGASMEAHQINCLFF